MKHRDFLLALVCIVLFAAMTAMFHWPLVWSFIFGACLGVLFVNFDRK